MFGHEKHPMHKDVHEVCAALSRGKECGYMEILVGREHIDPRLPMQSDPSLARVMGHLNQCVCFAAMEGETNVAACLLSEQSDGVCDIVNFSVSGDSQEHGVGKELLLHVMNYAREKGFRYLETGVGNSDLGAHDSLQKTGFRIIGVTPNYYLADGKSPIVQNGIVNRDMVRYRVDFNDGWVTWTKEVKYK